MSDLARLRADIARTLGVEQIPSLELGGAAGVGGERIAELAGAPAALVSVRNRALDPGSDGWTAEELIEAVEATGRTAGWLGISDAHGSLGRRAGLTCLIEDAGGKATAALAGGALGLGFDWVLDDASPTAKPRVLIASYEFVGPTRTGGIGTAYTSLAETLAAAGHEVTVLFSGWDEPGGEPLAHWADHYRKLGISLHGLPTETSPCAETGHRHADRAHQVYRWLRERERSGERFDVVHFPEVLGHGFYAIGAKRQGLAFAQTTFAIGTHSSTSWVLETNRTLCQAPDDFADEFIERRCVESTDTLISPSAYMLDWMRARGWTLPARHFVQQYARSQAVDALAAAAPAATPQAAGAAAPTEIVFFGRLEPRKGLVVFCDALDRLSERPELPPWRATFLGKHSEIDGVPAGAYVRERAALWSGEVELIDGMNQPQAVGYLRSGGRRVTVIPSLADNSPNTVYEALALEIPFIASRVGGTAELIDPRDLARSTFDPGEGGAAELARRLEGALAAEQLDAPRPSVAAGVCRDAHVTWHVRVAASAPPPVEPPEPPPLSVQIVGDDPAAIRRTRDSLAGAAASEIGTAATHAEAGSSAATDPLCRRRDRVASRRRRDSRRRSRKLRRRRRRRGGRVRARRRNDHPGCRRRAGERGPGSPLLRRQRLPDPRRNPRSARRLRRPDRAALSGARAALPRGDRRPLDRAPARRDRPGRGEHAAAALGGRGLEAHSGLDRGLPRGTAGAASRVAVAAPAELGERRRARSRLHRPLPRPLRAADDAGSLPGP